MKLKKRIKYLLSIAQATDTTKPSTATPPAPNADLLAMFPFAEKLWGNYNKIIFQNIVSMLNEVLNDTSGGKVNFMTLKSNNFDFGGQTTANASERAILNFIKLLYAECFANARLNPNVTELTSEEKKEKINTLLSSTSDIDRIYGKEFEVVNKKFKMSDLINELRKLQTTSSIPKSKA